MGCGRDPEKSGWSPNSTRPSHWNVETHGKSPCKSHNLTPIFSMNPQPRREGTQASWKPQGEPQGVGFPRKQPPARTRVPVLIVGQHVGLMHQEGQKGQRFQPGEGPSPESQRQPQGTTVRG